MTTLPRAVKAAILPHGAATALDLAMPSRASLAIVVLYASTSGCALLYDFSDEGGGGSTHGATATGSERGASDGVTAPTGTGSSGCGFCAPEVEGLRPFRRVVGEGDPPTCPGGAEPIGSGFASVELDDATCACACSIAGGGCKAQVGKGYDCTAEGALLTIDPETCTPFGGPQPVDVIFVATTAPLLCMPSDTIVQAPSPRLQDRASFCAVDATCEGGTCFAAPTDACIFAPTDAPCPAPYPHEHVYFTDTNDRRRCSGCACTPDAGPCEGELLVFDASGQCVTELDSIGLGACTGQVVASSVKYRPAAMPTCEVTGESTPGGDVVGDVASQARICCAG